MAQLRTFVSDEKKSEPPPCAPSLPFSFGFLVSGAFFVENTEGAENFCNVQRSAKVLVRGLVKFVPALA